MMAVSANNAKKDIFLVQIKIYVCVHRIIVSNVMFMMEPFVNNAQKTLI